MMMQLGSSWVEWVGARVPAVYDAFTTHQPGHAHVSEGGEIVNGAQRGARMVKS